MKLMATSSAAAYPVPLKVGAGDSKQLYGAITGKPTTVCREPDQVFPLKAPPGLEHLRRPSSGKDSDDGYDSSQSTCEASVSDGSSFCSWEEASVRSSSSLDTSESVHEHQVAVNKLSWHERSNLLLPFISGWAQLLGLTQSCTSLMELQRLILEHPTAQNCSKRMQHRDIERLRQGLENLQMQELLELMPFQEAPLSVQLSIDTFSFQLQQEMSEVKRRKQGSKTKRRM